MAQLVLGAVGSVVGGMIGGPTGARIGWAVGSALGASLGPTQRSFGPRLDDLQAQRIEYGSPINVVRGRSRTTGVPIWASDKRELATTESTGKGGPPTAATTYTYEQDILLLLSGEPIVGVARIWANGELVYSVLNDSDDASIGASVTGERWTSIQVHTGEAAQAPDAIYEAAVGVGSAPAYRGRGTIMIEGLQLGTSGQAPLLSFEVVTAGTLSPRCVVTDEDVILQLCMEGAHGSTTFTDASTYGHAVTAQGTAKLTTAEYHCGSASMILQPGDGLVMTDMPEFEAAPFTVRFFFKELATGDGVWCGRGTDSGSYKGWRLRFEHSFDNIYFQHIPVVGAVFSRRWSIDPEYFATWRDIALVVDTMDVALYLDGVLQTPAVADVGTFSISVVAGEYFVVGKQTDSSSALPTSGYYDALQVFSRALDESEITGQCPVGVQAITPTQLDLADEVDWLCARAGLAAADVDTSALAGIMVDGYAVSQIAAVRSVLEMLASAYYFEAVESDKLRMRLRGGSSVATVDWGDLGDTGTADPLAIERGNDTEVPARVALSYANLHGDYETGTEHSDRLAAYGPDIRQITLPLVLEPAKARGIAETMALDARVAATALSPSFLPWHAALEPTDVVTLTDDTGITYRARLVRETLDAGLARYDAVLDDPTVLIAVGVTRDDYEPTVNVLKPADTTLRLLDIPLLRDADNRLGHYAAAKPTAGGRWGGASVQRSVGGAAYLEAAVVAERAVLGTATTVLPAWTGGNVTDETSTVTVDVGAGELSSVTHEALLADATLNAAALGAEIIRYRTATLVSAGIYTLSGLLRGQRGTEWAMATHAASDPFARLSTSGLRYVDADLAQLGASANYKGVTVGRSLDTAAAQAFTLAAVSSKPLSPVDLRVDLVGGSSDLGISWRRRSRLQAPFLGTAGLPIGETSERYEIDIVLVSTGAVLRTLSATSQGVTYTTAQQAADSLSLGTAIRVDVYQLADVIGRGYPGSITTASAATTQPQVATVTLGGTFETGAACYIKPGTNTVTHTTVGGDTDLSGVATALAALVDALPDYTASAVGPVITITGPASLPWTISAGTSAGGRSMTLQLTQTASDDADGYPRYWNQYWADYSLVDPPGTIDPPLYWQEGDTFNVKMRHPSHGERIYTWTGDANFAFCTYLQGIQRIHPGLVSAIGASGDVARYGWSVHTINSSTGLHLSTSDADIDWMMDFWSSSLYVVDQGRYRLEYPTSIGQAATPARPQIVTYTVIGAPATGISYTITLDATPYTHVATAGDTTAADIAADLAVLVDAAPNYTATALGAVVTVTHITDNTPYQYYGSVSASTITLAAAITQEAI